jgi:hypothetical protein
LKRETKILSIDRDKYQVGASIEVNYSKINPRINETAKDPFKSDGNIFMILGVLLFGLLGINSIKGYKKKSG